MNTRYVGNLENGIRSGYGKLYEENILVYEGEWRNNKYDGRGKLYYKNGNINYEGNWCNGEQYNGIKFSDNGSHLFESAFDLSESIIFDQEGDIDLINEDIDSMFDEIDNRNNIKEYVLEERDIDIDLNEPLINNKKVKKNKLEILCIFIKEQIGKVYNYIINMF